MAINSDKASAEHLVFLDLWGFALLVVVLPIVEIVLVNDGNAFEPIGSQYQIDRFEDGAFSSIVVPNDHAMRRK